MSADHESLAPTLELVERYVVGDLSPAESEWVTAYLAAHKSAAVALEALRRSVDLANGSAGDAERGWQQLIERVEVSRRNDGKASNARRGVLGKGGGRVGSQTLLHHGMWVAGMVAIVAAVFAIVRRTPYDDGSLARTYATPIGRQAIITLDDSTRVVLSPNTIIRLVHLNQRSRIVRLERGAAHFTVVHASGAPFLVQSDIASARVLGTEFLVSRDPARAQVHVAVERGKVLVSLARMSDTGVTLTAGQVSDVTDSSNHVSAIGDVAPSAEWTPGHLWFRHTAVATILQTLSRWYGYQFRYSDSTLAQRNVTIGLSTQSGTTALSTIAQVLAVNVAVVGDTVTLTPQRVQPLPSMPRARTYDVWTPTKEVGR